MAATTTSATGSDDRRAKAIADYRKRLLEHREIEAKVKERTSASLSLFLSLSLCLLPVFFNL